MVRRTPSLAAVGALVALVGTSAALAQDKPGEKAPPRPGPAPAPAPARLQAEARRSPDDVARVVEQLEKVAALEKERAVGGAAASDLREALLSTVSSVVVSGVLEDLPLSLALEAVLQAAGEKGGRVSLVLAAADRELLAALRVSATFHGARDVDAVRALLRLHESARDDDQAFVEWTEDGGVFVVRATKLDREPEPFQRGGLVFEPVPGEREPTEPTEPAQRAWLGVTWVDQNPRGPGAGGVLVTQVLPGSPAVTAGIQAGDLITGFGEDGDEAGDETVMTGDDLRRKIAGQAPGDVVIVQFVRDGAVRRVSLALGTAPGR